MWGMALDKKWLGVLCSTVFIGLATGCAPNSVQFRTNDVHIQLLSHQSSDGVESYTFRIRSTSPVKLTNISLYLSYPIKIPNGSEQNPFAVRGQPNLMPADLKKGQSVVFQLSAPIRKVFGESKLLDFSSPEIDLQGYSQQGSQEIPFEMGGSIDALVQQPTGRQHA